ncbi:hypothetical protein E5Q_00346 [Mixia osmundae IAM 14324]|uniref:RRM domain-containing protein n=1 Tax=Mixia osmundae (strain CBS 9802 / IAM 14324 / JCM 22182 / KY 12970) TaxID=764103 RepID=G7DSZ1_MIXOS|nr:hypothetical protein E5Q_00346 [Mixia osmundae IAM 14324]
MSLVNQIRTINARQLELGGGSWHDEYRESAYIYMGGLDEALTEGDVITIASQYGEVVNVEMPRDKTTHKPRGFAFVMYEDQRSTVLAVDNLTGSKLLERTLRVDHVKNFKHLEHDQETGLMKERSEQSLNALPEKHITASEAARAVKPVDSDGDLPDIDLEDPMAAYLIEQAREKRRSSSKHDGETKEERKRRHEQKKLKRAAKASSLDRPRASSRDERPYRRERSPRASRRSRSPDRHLITCWTGPFDGSLLRPGQTVVSSTGALQSARCSPLHSLASVARATHAAIYSLPVLFAHPLALNMLINVAVALACGSLFASVAADGARLRPALQYYDLSLTASAECSQGDTVIDLASTQIAIVTKMRTVQIKTFDSDTVVDVQLVDTLVDVSESIYAEVQLTLESDAQRQDFWSDEAKATCRPYANITIVLSADRTQFVRSSALVWVDCSTSPGYSYTRHVCQRSTPTVQLHVMSIDQWPRLTCYSVQVLGRSECAWGPSKTQQAHVDIAVLSHAGYPVQFFTFGRQRIESVTKLGHGTVQGYDVLRLLIITRGPGFNQPWSRQVDRLCCRAILQTRIALGIHEELFQADPAFYGDFLVVCPPNPMAAPASTCPASIVYEPTVSICAASKSRAWLRPYSIIPSTSRK